MGLLELLNEEDDADKPKKGPAVVSSQDIGNGGSQEQTDVNTKSDISGAENQ